jgi:hypothetical protein
MVKSILSSLPTYYIAALKIIASILNQIDRCIRHGISGGSDVNAKKASSCCMENGRLA